MKDCGLAITFYIAMSELKPEKIEYYAIWKKNIVYLNSQ